MRTFLNFSAEIFGGFKKSFLPLHHQNNINNKDNEKVHRKSNPMVEVT